MWANVVKDAEYMQALDRPLSRREIACMSIAPHLLEILRCPKSLGELIYIERGQEEFLFCAESKLRYRIDNGIPVMLVDEAESLDDAACAALVSEAAEKN
jgi:hypothetical protein